MKFVSTKVIKDGVEKRVAVQVDERTVEVLSQVDEKTRHEYILAEYKIFANEQRQKYHEHASIEFLKDLGLQFADGTNRKREEQSELENEYALLHEAIKTLSAEQQFMVIARFFKGISVNEIAIPLGIDPSTTSHRFATIYKKIKKFLEKSAD